MRLILRLIAVACVLFTLWTLWKGDTPEVQIVEREVPVVVERPVVARPSRGNAVRIIVGDPNYAGGDRVVWEAKR